MYQLAEGHSDAHAYTGPENAGCREQCRQNGWVPAMFVRGDSLINRRALQDESESTSLHLAADGNHCDVLELLLKNGAQMELKVFLN